MAALLKMTVENWFFDYNWVNIEYFYVLSLLLVNDQKTHKSYKKDFLSDSKWRLKFKMATNFQ
jgi:hypothetical protein